MPGGQRMVTRLKTGQSVTASFSASSPLIAKFFGVFGVPDGIRTRVIAVKETVQLATITHR